MALTLYLMLPAINPLHELKETLQRFREMFTFSFAKVRNHGKFIGYAFTKLMIKIRKIIETQSQPCARREMSEHGKATPRIKEVNTFVKYKILRIKPSILQVWYVFKINVFFTKLSAV